VFTDGEKEFAVATDVPLSAYSIESIVHSAVKNTSRRFLIRDWTETVQHTARGGSQELNGDLTWRGVYE
jgi:hypothetical protein